MKTQLVGEIAIDRIVEAEGAFRDYASIVPGATQDLIDANADWLSPRFIAPDGLLIMAFHALVLRTPRRTILVDCCVGNDKDRPLRPMWHRQQTPFLERMRTAGVAPEDVDIVMCTHMHADHVGWNTQLVDNRWVPTFPNARYVFARKEYEFWEAEARRAKAEGAAEPPLHGAFDDSVLPVMEAGRAVLVEADHELDHGVWLEPAFGHTPGNVNVNVRSGGRHALLSGDTMHTPLQLCDPGQSSAFCEDPEMSARSRTAMVERLADTASILLAGHFPTPVAGRIVRHRNAFRLETGD